jgi:hypothetical protein
MPAQGVPSAAANLREVRTSVAMTAALHPGRCASWEGATTRLAFRKTPAAAFLFWQSSATSGQARQFVWAGSGLRDSALKTRGRMQAPMDSSLGPLWPF